MKARSLAGWTALGPLVLLLALMGGVAHTTAGTASSIDPFAGAFAGTSVRDPTGALAPEDLSIRIRRERQGFVLDWTSAVIEKGHTERFGHEVHFEATRKHNVFRAHRGPSISGDARAPDPIDGKPYFWARISGDALIVYVTAIHDDGTLDLRIYRRALVADGMALDFTHIVDDRTVTRAHGTLQRTE